MHGHALLLCFYSLLCYRERDVISQHAHHILDSIRPLLFKHQLILADSSNKNCGRVSSEIVNISISLSLLASIPQQVITRPSN